MLDILLVRHAHTYWNAQRMIWYSGETDRLDELWHSQIAPLGEKLSKRIEGLLHTKRRRVVFHRSPTNRTRETLELSLGQLVGIEDYHIRDPHGDLDEIHMWDMISKPIDEELFKRILSSVEERFPNGESRKDVGNRMWRYIRSLEPDTIHVVFSHGVAISSAVHEVLWSYDKRLRLWNATISHLRVTESRLPEIVSLGE